MKEIAAAIKAITEQHAAAPHVNNERTILRLQQAQALVDERDRDVAKQAKIAADKAKSA